MCCFSPRKQAWSSGNFSSGGVPLNQLWDSATKLRNECFAFIHIAFLFKVRAIMLLSTQWDAVRWNKFQLLHACLRGKSSTCLKMTLPQNNSPRIKTPYPYLMNLDVKLLGKEYSIQYSKNQWYSIKNVVEITGSKSLHSFWATPYIRVTKTVRMKSESTVCQNYLVIMKDCNSARIIKNPLYNIVHHNSASYCHTISYGPTFHCHYLNAMDPEWHFRVQAFYPLSI